MSDARACYGCGTEIINCNGFTRSDDFVEWIEGRRAELPRELCGRCMLRKDIADAGGIEAYKAEIERSHAEFLTASRAAEKDEA